MNLPSTLKGLRDRIGVLEILRDSYAQSVVFAEHKETADFYSAKVAEVDAEKDACEAALVKKAKELVEDVRMA